MQNQQAYLQLHAQNLPSTEGGLVQGSLPLWLVTLIIGRDVVLLSGAFAHRFRTLGWQWPGAAEFFRVASSPPPRQAPSASNSATDTHQSPGNTTGHGAETNSISGKGSREGQTTAHQSHAIDSIPDSISSISSVGSLRHGKVDQQEAAGMQTDDRGAVSKKSPPAVFVQPLYISKVNTCFQLLLIGGCLTSSWYAWPPQEALFALGVVTGGTTLASCGAYVRAYLNRTIK